MNKLNKLLGAIFCMTSLLTFVACGGTGGGNNGGNKPDDTFAPTCNIYFSEYEDVTDISDVSAYEGEVATNLPVDDGIIVSPYYTLKINDTAVPVYASRTASGTHSFAYIDVEVLESGQPFRLNVDISFREASTVLDARKPLVAVLPESTGVEATLGERGVEATIQDFGSYSFAFNKKPDEALTLFVAEKEDTAALFGDYEIKYIEPGDYSRTDTKNATVFTEPNKVYYFKAGRYKTDCISIASDCIVYFERNAYCEVLPPEDAPSSYALMARGQNVRVAGRGLLDFSACCGGEVPEGYYNNKGGIVFDYVENVSLSGLTVVNSQTWTICMNACKGVQIDHCLLFSYRVYSDGIMLSDCIDAVVEDSFIHTGDDGFETKSTTSSEEPMRNVVFRNNAVWTDKAVAYGCIYESNKDTSDVHFENCSVGFAMGTWSNHLGCCVIQMGNNREATMSKIYFNDIEVYLNQTPGLLNVYIGGSGGRGEGWGHVKNIFFNNVTAKTSYGAYLNLQTYTQEDTSIEHLYLNNIVANGVQLDESNYLNKGNITISVAGGYDLERYLHLNTGKLK